MFLLKGFLRCRNKIPAKKSQGLCAKKDFSSAQWGQLAENNRIKLLRPSIRILFFDIQTHFLEMADGK